ncbi:MAG: DUF6318 family protein [Actinomycetaceae bacterium]|nr:DUF6318 family protein [Actinomycetaceae bacterium]
MGQDLAEELHRKRFDYTNLYPVLGVIAVVVIAWGGWFASGKIREHNLAENKRIGQEYNESLKSPAGPEKAGENKETVTSKENETAIDVPIFPEKANEDSLEGAQAVTEYWIETYNYGVQTGDLRPMKQLCEEAASFCQIFIKDIASFHAKGGHVEGAHHWPTELACAPEQNTHLCVFTMNYNSGKTIDKEGNVVYDDPPGFFDFSIRSKMVDGQRKVVSGGRPVFEEDEK